MTEIEELSLLLSNEPILDLILSLKAKHEEILKILSNAEREVKKIWKKKTPDKSRFKN